MEGSKKESIKQGWGFSKDVGSGVKLDISQKADKKTNIWEQQNENLIVIPDVEEDPNEVNTKTVSQPPQMINKIQNLSELHQSDRQYMLPQTDENIDLGILISTLRPMEDIMEKDENWEFQKLKSEIYEMVSNLYGVHELYDEDK